MPPQKDFRPRTSWSKAPPLPHQIPPDTLIDPGIGQNSAPLPRDFLNGIQMAPLLPQLPIFPMMRDLHKVFPAVSNLRLREGVPTLWLAAWMEDGPLEQGAYLPGTKGLWTSWPNFYWAQREEIYRVAFGIPMDIRVRVSTRKTYALTSWMVALVDVPPEGDYLIVRLPNELELGVIRSEEIRGVEMSPVRQTLIREIGYGILDDDEIEQMKDPNVGRTILTKRFWHTVLPDLVDFDEMIVTQMTLFQSQQEMEGIR